MNHNYDRYVLNENNLLTMIVDTCQLQKQAQMILHAYALPRVHYYNASVVGNKTNNGVFGTVKVLSAKERDINKG